MSIILKSFLSSIFYRFDYLLRLLLGKEKRWQLGLECETVALGRGGWSLVNTSRFSKLISCGLLFRGRQ